MKSSFHFICALLMLTACGGGGPASDRFVLASDEATFSDVAHARHPRSGTLKIVLPVAAPGLDSVQIAVMQENGKLGFTSGREWAEPLPKLVQAQLVEASEQANLFSSVVPDSQGVASRYSLMTDIREFAIYQNGSDSKAKVRLVARVVSPTTRAVLATVSSSHSAPLDKTGGAMAAFNEASAKAVKDVIARIAKRLK